MKILLIQPPFNPNLIGGGVLYMNEPLALETIAGAVSEHEVNILDMRIDPGLENTLNSFNRPLTLVVSTFNRIPDNFTNRITILKG